jgi:hypothetical protein
LHPGAFEHHRLNHDSLSPAACVGIATQCADLCKPPSKRAAALKVSGLSAA